MLKEVTFCGRLLESCHDLWGGCISGLRLSKYTDYDWIILQTGSLSFHSFTVNNMCVDTPAFVGKWQVFTEFVSQNNRKSSVQVPKMLSNNEYILGVYPVDISMPS